MERREFVAGVGGLAVTGWFDVPDITDGYGERKAELIARRTVRDGTRIPLRLSEDAKVTVKVDVREGSGFSVAVMGLGSMENKRITDEDELVVETDKEDEHIVDVTGDGRAQILVVRD